MAATPGGVPVFADASGQNIQDSGIVLSTLEANITTVQSALSTLQQQGTTLIRWFWCIGQSNMTGTGNNTGGSVPTVPAGCFQFNGTSLVAANSPVGGEIGGGPIESFCCTYNAITGENILIIQSAIGGTDMSAAEDAWVVGNNGNWDVTGTLRGPALVTLNNALNAAVAAGYVPVPGGVLFALGENAASAIVASSGAYTATQYGAALEGLITFTRTSQIGPTSKQTTYADLPWYISLLGALQTGENSATQEIRAEQEAVIAGTNNVFTGFSGALDFVYQSPQLIQSSPNAFHYTNPGYVKMGRGLAQAAAQGGESTSGVAKTRQLIGWSSPTSGSAGNTYMLGPGGLTATGNNGTGFLMPVGLSGRIRNLYCSVVDLPPGTGQSVTFTVYYKGVATALTCQITGTNTIAQDLLDLATIDASGGEIQIQVVFSSGAASSRVNATFELDNP